MTLKIFQRKKIGIKPNFCLGKQFFEYLFTFLGDGAR